jgi:hypothetical protein
VAHMCSICLWLISSTFVHPDASPVGASACVLDEGSENNSEGVPPTRDADEGVPMDEDDNGGETPRKARPGKRPMVVSPTPEKEEPLSKRQTRDIKTKAPVRTTDTQLCWRYDGVCYRSGVALAGLEGGRTVSARLARRSLQRHALTVLSGRSPAIPKQIGPLQAQHRRCRAVLRSRNHQGTPQRQRRLGGSRWLVRVLFPSPMYLPNTLLTGKATPPTLEGLYTLMQNNHMELCDRIATLESMLRDQSKSNTTTSRHPPVPAFNAPSPAISTSGLSAASAGSGVSATNIARMTLESPSIAGPSGTGDGQSEAQGKSLCTWGTWPSSLIISGRISDSQEFRPALGAVGGRPRSSLQGSPVPRDPGRRLSLVPSNGTNNMFTSY